MNNAKLRSCFCFFCYIIIYVNNMLFIIASASLTRVMVVIVLFVK